MASTSEAVKVPMEVEYQGAWLTWVAATTTCLRALDVECDLTDVAGMSGYAFHLCVHPELCPSGPTVLDWGALHFGPKVLGRSTLCYYGGEDAKSARTAIEMARREVGAGRPCVIWGAYVPEFAAIVGVEGDSYLVKSYREITGEPQTPIPHDSLQAPGGVYLLAFPDECAPWRGADRWAISRALHLLTTPPATYHYGAAAFDLWVEALEAKRANAFGNSYNAACYAEAHRFARDFLARVAERNPSVGDKLRRASEAYGAAWEEMNRLTKQFPFPGAERENVTDDNAIRTATDSLRKAKDDVCRAIGLLARVVAMEWA